ncbi:MAG: YggT family protein [Verrucomicrobia bacterium]|nr:YggT family protein [Verrucomicrobiota bacterium]
MISTLRDLIDLALKLFALGLFIDVILSWLAPPPLRRLQQALDRFYEPFLNPIRRCVRPFRVFPNAPQAVDLSPLILLLLIWWLVHPFLMWVFS